MAKTKTSPRSRPRKKSSQKKPSSLASSARSRRKSSPSRSVEGRASRTKISYEKNGRTDLIIDWLTDHVDDRIRLFSDNVQDASAEGRRLRTGKSSKMVYYRKIADAVFQNDQDEEANYAKDPEKYAKSIENHIRGYVRCFCCGHAQS
jgi:hypothetical protein